MEVFLPYVIHSYSCCTHTNIFSLDGPVNTLLRAPAHSRRLSRTHIIHLSIACPFLKGASALPWRPEEGSRRSGQTKGRVEREERGTSGSEEKQHGEGGRATVGDKQVEGAVAERQRRTGEIKRGDVSLRRNTLETLRNKQVKWIQMSLYSHQSGLREKLWWTMGTAASYKKQTLVSENDWPEWYWIKKDNTELLHTNTPTFLKTFRHTA